MLIEIFFDPPHVSLHERLLTSGYLIHIRARSSIMARMETTGCGLDIEHHDVGGQQIVHALLDYCRTLLYLRCHLNVHHLTESMHARIGSAGPLHLHVGPENLPYNVADFAHDGARVFLFLPPTVTRAVVFE